MDDNPEHPIGGILFQDVELDVGCWYDAGEDQWLIELISWGRHDDPGTPPETCWGLQRTHARRLAALLTEAADVAELFQSAIK